MKKTLLLCLTLYISLWANAQATDLVIDCQTPGWLSNKINYGDQQTVKNLKVTGYINSDDLKFIGQLIQQQNLKGHLDLADVNIVGNKMLENSFSINDINNSIQRIDLPKSVTEFSKCLYYNRGGTHNYLNVDTLVFEPDNINYVGANFFDRVQYGSAIKNLVLGEKVDSIPGQYDGFWEYSTIQSVHFKGKIRYLGDYAFSDTPLLAGMNVEAFDSLEYVGKRSLSVGIWRIDTLYQPRKLTNFPIGNFPFQENAHVFFDTTLKSIISSSSSVYQYPINLHFKTIIPPACSFVMRNPTTIYVPKGAKSAYEKDQNFKDTNIIEENPITKIVLDKDEITIDKGEKITLNISIVPEDADDKRIKWTSDNKEVATVDAKGKVTAIKAGKAVITVTSEVDSNISASCIVTVVEPVAGVILSETTYKMKNIGESVQLTATVLPEEAGNKNVKWTSSDTSICVVSKGLVVATGFGTAVIFVTTEEGEYMAFCTITVEKETSVADIEADLPNQHPIYNLMGNKVERTTKGHLYIKKGKKFLAK